MNSARLKMAIAESGYTQKKLADELNINKNTLNLKINGKVRMSVAEANSILKVLNIEDPLIKSEIFLSNSSQK